jgi:pimeloyl-ACP methyl ester carboxylesterase
MPTTTPWNGDLMIYAHGYAAPDKPVGIPENQMSLPGSDTMVDEIVNSLGFAFATTSYYTNGLAVLPALANLLDLVDVFSRTQEAPHRIYLAGVSEGGLITTLALEQYPDVYDGGLAMCGPYGSFEVQTNHLGDAPVIFDYFFPGLMPGTAVDIPESLMEQWEAGFYSTTIRPVGQCLTMRPTSIRSTNC